MLKKLTIRKKLLLYIIAINIVAITGVILFMVDRTTDMQKEAVSREAKATAYNYANKYAAKIEYSMTTVKQIAIILSNYKNIPIDERRNNCKTLIESIIKSDSNFLSIYAVFEPNAFDGKESILGREIGFVRRDDGTFKFGGPMEYVPEEEDFYTVPRDTKLDFVKDPYKWAYEKGGKEYFEISLVAPIIVDGKFIGVIGVDIPMAHFQEEISKIKPNEIGYALMCSANSSIVFHPKEGTIGKKFSEALTEIDQKFKVSEHIINGKDLNYSVIAAATGIMSDVYFAPFKIGSYPKAWSFGVVLPQQKIYADIKAMQYFAYTLGAIVILLIGIIIYFIANGINKTLNQIKNEIENSVNAVISGKLDFRTNINNANFEFKPLLIGINSLIDSFVKPLNIIAEYLDRISKGDLPYIIDEDYKGDFNEIKTNVNALIESTKNVSNAAYEISNGNLDINLIKRSSNDELIGAFIKMKDELNELQKALVDSAKAQEMGEIDHIVSADNFKGAYKEIATSYNKAISTLNNNVVKILSVMTKYGEGDLSITLEKMPGKQILANHALDKVRENLLGVSSEINIVIESALDGRLSVRADSSRFSGEYKGMIDGLNKTLDAIIGPLHVSAKYIDNLANGVIPATITDHYNGDFNGIKNSLNNLISTISLLAGQLEKTSKAQAIGEIDAYADTSKFVGVYKELGDNYNLALNVLNTSIEKILTIVAKYGEGDLKAKLETLPGKQIVANHALDKVQTNLLGLSGEINMLITAAVQGNLSVRGNEAKFSGDYKAMVHGLNETLDAIVYPLNLSADYLTKIANGEQMSKIDINLLGDYAIIKDSVNRTVSIIEEFNSEIHTLITASTAGDLTKRANSQQIIWLLV